MQSNPEIDVHDHGNGRIDLLVNRAHKHNALSRAVLTGLGQIVTHYGSSSAARFIVIRGAGDRYFAAGGDLVDLTDVRTPEMTKVMSDEARSSLDCIRQCPVPVIAYLNGTAIGGGAELALACDMRLMTPSARIGYVQAKLAITPAWGGGTDLCALVGASRALRMLSRCEMVDAELALSWGLADAIITDGFEGDDLRRFLEPLLERSNTIMRALKRQTRAWRDGSSYEDRRAIERADLIETWIHEDHWAAAEGLLSKGRQ